MIDDFERRLSLIESKTRQHTVPPPRQPTSGDFGEILREQHETARSERVAAAAAEHDRQEREAQAAEAERVRQWERHRPKRERAMFVLEKLEPEISEAQRRLDTLIARRWELREEAQKFAKPVQPFGRPDES